MYPPYSAAMSLVPSTEVATEDHAPMGCPGALAIEVDGDDVVADGGGLGMGGGGDGAATEADILS